MWTVTFFSTDSAAKVASAKSKQATNEWHVMVGLLESSPPSFFDAKLVVNARRSIASHPTQTPRPREARSTTSPRSRDKGRENWASMYDYNYSDRIYSRPSSSSNLPSSTHSYQGPFSYSQTSTTRPPPISISLKCGDRKLGSRISSGEPPGMHSNSTDVLLVLDFCVELMAKPTTKPDTWSDHGVGYTSAAVSSLGEGLASQLLHE